MKIYSLLFLLAAVSVALFWSVVSPVASLGEDAVCIFGITVIVLLLGEGVFVSGFLSKGYSVGPCRNMGLVFGAVAGLGTRFGLELSDSVWVLGLPILCYLLGVIVLFATSFGRRK